jgi:hypothetical protein
MVEMSTTGMLENCLMKDWKESSLHMQRGLKTAGVRALI